MSSTQARRILAQKNQILRQQNNRLNDKKHDIAQHLSTIIRRCKQMQNLKISLRGDLQRSIQNAKIIRNKKKAYIQHLYTDITGLQGTLVVEVTQLKKLQGEYQICLQDYDNVLKLVTEQIQGCRVLQTEITAEKQNNANMKAMIFDYERLKRVLEQQKNYFKELSNSQEKSHEERVKQLEKIYENLKNQEEVSHRSLRLNKFRAGYNRINLLFKTKIKQYAQKFIRTQTKIYNTTQLGIKTFRNCLELANLKHKLSTRKLFYQWHHNIFPKQTLRNIVQNTAIKDIQSKKKIFTLNKMTQQVYDKNIAVFHLYEKGKYLKIISNKIVRKDLHYGFNKWRDNYKSKAQKLNFLSNIINKTIPNSQKRTAFKKWKNNAAIQNRLLLANHLLDQYINAKQLCRVFRKWRFSINQYQLDKVNSLIFNIKLQNKITSRINYEKRKSKVLTLLTIKMTKIKLRNYFIKYWANVKGIHIKKEKKIILDQKQRFSQNRAQQKKIVAKTSQQNQKLSLKIFRIFMMNSKLKPVMKKWQNTAKYMKKQSQAILHLAFKKQAKTKIYVMNEFRKCVQYFQKKQMHQVLTDLNKKMQAINEKSTNFRDRLKKCIQDLGNVASKKIQYLFNYSVMCQQRVYFNTDLRKNIKKLYKQYILYRFESIMVHYAQKKTFNQLSIYAKNLTKQIKLQKAQKRFMKNKLKRDLGKAFYALRGMLRTNKTSFQRMGQADNIFWLYRLASAFVAIQRKNCAQKIKQVNKKIISNEAVLVTKKDNISNLKDQKAKLQEQLTKVFSKFVRVQDRSLILKQKKNINMLTKRYFTKYRQNVQERIYADKILLHFGEFINQKNMLIFWKGANAIRYENTIAIVKQQLGKLNRKKKTFEEKKQKGMGDVDKRMSQAVAVNSQKYKYYDFYLKKFESILKTYERIHSERQNLNYVKSIFKAWKAQYTSTKRIALGINNILQRNLVFQGFKAIVKRVKDEDSQLKSQYICAFVLQRKAFNCMRDCIILWRSNMRKLQCQKLEYKTMEMIQSRQNIADQCKQKGKLVGVQKLRLKRKNMMKECFMLWKDQIHEKVYYQRFISRPINEKKRQRLLRTCINGLKWLMFYKKTKRAYLKFTKQRYQKLLKSDVFLSLKIYRQEHYKFVNKIQGVYDNVQAKHLRNGLNKIVNLGIYRKDILNYQRRKALRHLVMNKITKVHLIKRKIMSKWHAWLIPKQHYLPNIIKQFYIKWLRKSFANIREHAYWNPIYIKKSADQITSEGYSQINTATNNLVKQGYDPQQIKQYLTKHNEKDTKNIRMITNRIKIWGSKQILVRAWNSWQQYITLKRKIRKSLSKVFTIAQGLGRCWNRWKHKDIKFNAILQKQSRGNMLFRYRDLGRLLKQYKRDVKDSKIYCQQLKDVNDQYDAKNDQGIRIALTSLSTNVQKGLKQGLQIWRSRIQQYRRDVLDERYDQLSQGISLLLQQKNKLKYKILTMREQNIQLKAKCTLGKQCGEILQKLMKERDNLSIDLADKQHNMKLLLEDNLRLKQKIRAAKVNAQKLINKVQNIEHSQN